jgi:hypothetical protein
VSQVRTDPLSPYLPSVRTDPLSPLGWRIRQRGDGAIAFDDGVGEVSGTWVTGRAPATTPGLLINVPSALTAVRDAGLGHRHLGIAVA